MHFAQLAALGAEPPAVGLGDALLRLPALRGSGIRHLCARIRADRAAITPRHAARALDVLFDGALESHAARLARELVELVVKSGSKVNARGRESGKWHLAHVSSLNFTRGRCTSIEVDWWKV